jgi:hypothetical protein
MRTFGNVAMENHWRPGALPVYGLSILEFESTRGNAFLHAQLCEEGRLANERAA